MSKNITIQEGGTDKSLNSIKKIKTSKQGGGSVLWIPEDDIDLGTKTITKNGTYKAKNDGKTGYSQVTVKVTNKAVGKDPSDGNDYSVNTDDNGNLVKTSLPSSITVTTPPTKTTYSSGEAIDTTGMVVTAYKADGTVWNSNSSYPNGVIPLNEITINPTTATGISSAPTNISSASTYAIIGYRYYTKTNDTPAYVGYFFNKYVGHRMEPFLFSTSQDGIASTSQIECINTGRGVYWNQGYGADYQPQWCEGQNFGDLKYTNDPTDPEGAIKIILDQLGVYADNGHISVIWERPEDGKELSASFNITTG